MAYNPMKLQSCHAKSTNDALSYRSTTLNGNGATTTFEIFLVGSVNQIALAESRPIQPVPLVKDHLMDFGLACSALSGTQDNADARLKPDAILGRENHCRVLAGVGKLPS